MKRFIFSLVLFLGTAALLFPEIESLVNQIDALHDGYKHEDVITLIENSLSGVKSDKDKAELYWRLARATLYTGDMAEDAGKPKEEILPYFEQAEALADQAISLDPDNPGAYFWKSSSLGRWGQVKGILDSLFKAKPMKIELEKALNKDPDYAAAYKVLGMLYEALPGWPLSFGDPDNAVSLGRRSLDLHLADVRRGKEKKIDYSFHIELAKELHKRDWNAKKRTKEQTRKKNKYADTRDVLEKNFYYEGNISLAAQSDLEEAEALLKTIITKLSALAVKTVYEEIDLKTAGELLAEWKG